MNNNNTVETIKPVKIPLLKNLSGGNLEITYGGHQYILPPGTTRVDEWSQVPADMRKALASHTITTYGVESTTGGTKRVPKVKLEFIWEYPDA